MKKPNIIQQIEQQIGKPLTQLDAKVNPEDAIRHKNNNSYLLDGEGNLIALNIIESDQLRKVDLSDEAKTLQYLNLSENKNLNELTIKVPLERLKKMNASYCSLNSLNFPGRFSKLEVLELQNNNLKKITFDIGFPNLRFLDLSNNKLSQLALPDGFDNLKDLFLSDNQLNELEVKSNCSKLETFHLQNNKVNDIGFLSEAIALHSLNLSKNAIIDLSPLRPLIAKGVPVELKRSRGIYIKENPISTPPLETVERGNEAILAYFQELDLQGADTLYEAKLLIIGEGGTGKTTLYRKLQDNDEMPTESESTRGIDIHILSFDIKQLGKKFTMHIWDFGGQEIYHATHQFFLTKRSLYVLVTDNRREEKNDYWLQVQKLYGESSPMIIVQNEKGGRKKELPINEMRENFPNVQPNTFAIDLSLPKASDKARFQELKSHLEKEILKQPHIGDTLPKQWLVIRKAIQELAKTKPYIEQKEYFELCKKHGIPEEDRALRLSEYLHDLGVFLHFQGDTLLEQTLFLENIWVTDGVFALIDTLNNSEKPDKWLFDEKIAKQIWCDERYGVRYKDKIAELIALIEKFELCYEVSKKNYQIPQLLPGTRPVKNVNRLFNRHRALQIHFEYGFMPKGLLSRLMVRLHRFIAGQDVIWNSGMLLYHSTYQAHAEIVETYSERDIRVWVKGSRVREFATVIIDEINLLNSTYGDNLKVNTFLPCICTFCRNNDEPNFYDNEALQKRQERSKPTIECPISYEDVNVQQIIENVIIVPKKVDSLKVFISYSKEDVAHLNALLTALKPLQRTEELLTWNDRDLVAGEDWDARIRQEITSADLVLVLLSADALATDYIWDYEIKQAINQSASGKSAVIPIIVRPCDWASSPLARLSALPQKAKAITAFADKDVAWQQVVAGIREVVQRIKASRE